MCTRRQVLGVLAVGGLFAAVPSVGLAQGGEELVVYSGRKEPLIQPVLERFQKETGVRVVLKSGDASALANQLIEEQKNPQADVFVANDAGVLGRLGNLGVLQPYLSASIAKIPARYRGAGWVGVTGRARVIMYNKSLIKEADLPKSLLDLSDPKYKGKIAAAGTANESMLGQLSEMRQVLGDEKTREFVRSLVANQTTFLKGHTDVRKAVGRGEFPLGIVNHYYYHLQLAEGSPVGVIYPDQGAGQMGTMINVSGVGIVKGAKHTAAAQRFVDFLATAPAQEIFAQANYEFPLLPGVQAQAGVRSLGDFKVTQVPLSALAKEVDGSLKLANGAGMP
ncbi:extracellular solute-binding protein [Gloeobacter morelensis]|uniref:Extracellular solute-binding protein n=1 Tax=Gloeobacter morelensis MG652769 TaxID=2781736 RepID=A0ABY3PTG5_9CYAN|nr:extracellular solute-binding protein [Gloeobacter morelensis]UFP96802.1 extracellular solute-binding protein [Gloeobacter morelensis MG652769]